ncbi:MAG TPA: lysophospholipid acyltransferase family protein [Sphingobacteriaceae bacterium]
MKRVSFFITVGLLYFISLLPFFVLYIFSDVLYIILFYVIKYRRKVVQENLLNAYPEKSIEERLRTEKKFYRFLADMIFESIKMFTITEKEINKRFSYTNLHVATKFLDAGRSVIAVTGHYSNWEWGSLSISANVKTPVLVVYKPLSDKKFENVLNRVRAKFGSVMIAMKQTLRKLVEYKGQPYMLVLLGDQTPVRGETQYFTSFLNQPTAVFLGIEKIARSTNSPVLFFTINRVKRGYYNAEVTILTENPQDTAPYEITNAHTRKLEQIINEKPEFWLWSHKRWKFKPEDKYDARIS